MNKISWNEILNLFSLNYPVLYCLVFTFALIGFSQLSFIVINKVFTFDQSLNFNFFTQIIVCASIAIGNYRYTKKRNEKTSKDT